MYHDGDPSIFSNDRYKLDRRRETDGEYRQDAADDITIPPDDNPNADDKDTLQTINDEEPQTQTTDERPTTTDDDEIQLDIQPIDVHSST